MNLTGTLGMVVGSVGPSKPERAPKIHNASVARVKHDLAGYGTTLSAMQFMRWAIERDTFPSIADVKTRFGVCNATAYRWTRALAECYGVDPAIRHQVDL